MKKAILGLTILVAFGFVSTLSAGSGCKWSCSSKDKSKEKTKTEQTKETKETKTEKTKTNI